MSAEAAIPTTLSPRVVPAKRVRDELHLALYPGDPDVG